MTQYYPEAWFRVDYEDEEDAVYLNFAAYKAESMFENHPAESIFEEDPCLKGWIKWDGCCEFSYSEHYCGYYAAEQFLMVMGEIYAYAKKHFKERYDSGEYIDANPTLFKLL